jgi:hypothetical protein
MEEKNNTITINGTDYAVKPGMKAIIISEKITGEAFRLKTTTDILAYCYAAILAGTPDSKLGFDELLEAIDAEPQLMKRLADMIITPTAAEKIMQLSNEGGSEPKKG